jgi:hypothetical protein
VPVPVISSSDQATIARQAAIAAQAPSGPHLARRASEVLPPETPAIRVVLEVTWQIAPTDG